MPYNEREYKKSDQLVFIFVIVEFEFKFDGGKGGGVGVGAKLNNRSGLESWISSMKVGFHLYVYLGGAFSN